ncbi:hypothetical protein ABZS96_30070, partial [Streptomyces avermitilis]|uniref:hypothetical protein n=1 Tax=Streptomyces avermitilis TaxID=33903 RepID=UPI0033A0E08B
MTIATWRLSVRYATLPPKRSTAQLPVLPPVSWSAVGSTAGVRVVAGVEVGKKQFVRAAVLADQTAVGEAAGAGPVGTVMARSVAPSWTPAGPEARAAPGAAVRWRGELRMTAGAYEGGGVRTGRPEGFLGLDALHRFQDAVLGEVEGKAGDDA